MDNNLGILHGSTFYVWKQSSGQCEEMSDTELIRAMSIEKDTYTEEFSPLPKRAEKKGRLLVRWSMPSGPSG